MKKLHLNHRPSIGSVSLAILVALYLIFMFNRTFWTRSFTYFNGDYALIFAVFVILACLFVALTVTISVKYLTKPLFIFLILAGSVASWFTDQFGTIIDTDMIANAVVTTRAEANNLITTRFIVHLLLTGVLPSLLIIWVRIRHRPLSKKILYNLAVIVPCLLLAVFTIISTSRSLMSTVREHRDLIKIINPIAPIWSVVKYALDDVTTAPIAFRQIGLDAKVVPVSAPPYRPRVTIVVAGETARAEDFSLDGYKRLTNPELAKRNIIYFANTTSCATATKKSLPCMFSNYGKNKFDPAIAAATETLPDVLSHAGIKVEWWENNTSSQGVADRIKIVNFYGRSDPEFCSEGECQDGIMLPELDRFLDNVNEDTVLFIHQLGSHGPAYFKRYPESFRKFRPDCRGLDFNKCTQEEIRNAYDNSILYTDYFLASIIDKLDARSKQFDGAMIYMSDHGESLGENGLYLHGMPYALAPRQQTEIPFVLWMSPSFALSMNADEACLKKDAAVKPLSHDNLFPSVLTMMNVETKIKDTSLDIFSACRSHENVPR